MNNLKKQICKLKIIYAKKPSLIKDNLERVKNKKERVLSKKIEPYSKITKNSNIYLNIEDRLFYSPTLNLAHIVSPKEVRDNLVKYILEGIIVTENSIETIVITTTRGTYHIDDVFEIVGGEELLNLKELKNEFR